MSSRFIFLAISLIIVWVLAFNSGHGLAFNLAYMLSAVLALSYFFAWSSTRSISLRRFTRTQRSQVGQFVEEIFEVSNGGALPKLWLEVEDFSELPGHGASRVISSLARNSSERWQIRTLCTRRGRFTLGPMMLRSGDPLGIFNVQRDLPATTNVIVYPLVVDLTTFEPSISDLSGGEARRQRTYQITTNVSSVRDYAPGDSLNRIHWLSTARARRLMTKEFELDPTADIWIYLDLFRDAQFSLPWEPTSAEVGLFAMQRRNRRSHNGQTRVELPPSSTEYGISIAASLARYFLGRDRAVGISSHGRTREFLQSDRGERQMNKVLEGLAVVEGEGSIPFAQVIAADSVRLNRNDTILAISADPNPEWGLALLDSQRRGINSIAIVLDSNSFGKAFDYTPLVSNFESVGLSYYMIQCGKPIDEVLANPANTIGRGTLIR